MVLCRAVWCLRLLLLGDLLQSPSLARLWAPVIELHCLGWIVNPFQRKPEIAGMSKTLSKPFFLKYTCSYSMLPLYRVLPAMKGYAREAWTVQRTVLTVAIIAVALVQVWIARRLHGD